VVEKRRSFFASFQFDLLIATAICLTIPSALAKAEDWGTKLEPGYKLLTQGQIEKSAEFFEKKVSKYPDSGACHTGYGRALKRWGKISQAKGEFARATQVDPNFPDGFYEYGIALEGDKQYVEASNAFQHFLSLAPNDAQRMNVPDRIRFCDEHK
jgi:tetratricopeptide (TPR) repeat protein